MSIYKRGKVYWYKFMWQGEVIRESTKQGNQNTARNMESAHRTALANGLVGIRSQPSESSVQAVSNRGRNQHSRRMLSIIGFGFVEVFALCSPTSRWRMPN
jgi:hypothetical protein